MSEIKGRYKINLNDTTQEIYSLKIKKYLGSQAERLQAFVKEKWTGSVSSLEVGKIYYISIPANTSFSVSDLGFIKAADCWGLTTEILREKRLSQGSTDIGFGASEISGVTIKGFFPQITESNQEYYKFEPTSFAFEGFFVCEGWTGNINPLLQYLYTSDSTETSYLWRKPYAVNVNNIKSRIRLDQAPGYYTPGPLTAKLNLSVLTTGESFCLEKTSGIDNVVDPVGSISKFQIYENGSVSGSISCKNALGCYGDSYNLKIREHAPVGCFNDSTNDPADYIYEDELNYEISTSITPTGLGSEDSSIDQYDYPAESSLDYNFKFKGFLVDIEFRTTQSYLVHNMSHTRTIYISYPNPLGRTQTDSIAPRRSMGIMTYPLTATIKVRRKAEGALDYQEFDLPQQ